MTLRREFLKLRLSVPETVAEMGTNGFVPHQSLEAPGETSDRATAGNLARPKVA